MCLYFKLFTDQLIIKSLILILLRFKCTKCSCTNYKCIIAVLKNTTYFYIHMNENSSQKLSTLPMYAVLLLALVNRLMFLEGRNDWLSEFT